MISIDLHGVTVRECPTNYGDYIVYFYPADHKEYKVKQEIPDKYSISHRETEEGGNLLILFFES